MRVCVAAAILLFMSEFNRQYLLLSIFVLAGLGAVVYTSQGGDPALGTFGSGIVIGVLIAFYVVRRAEMLIHRAMTRQDSNSGQSDLEEATFRSPRSESVENSSSIPNSLSSVEPRIHESERLPVHVQDEASSGEVIELQSNTEFAGILERCSCICGCSRRSITGDGDLCGNCLRWWIQQSDKCSCDDSTEECTCGAIRHGEAA